MAASEPTALFTPLSAFDPTRAALRTYLYAAVRNLALKQFRRPRLVVTLDDLNN